MTSNILEAVRKYYVCCQWRTAMESQLPLQLVPNTSGAAFRTFVLFNESDLEISGDTLKSYEDSDTAHGRPTINQFCSKWNAA